MIRWVSLPNKNLINLIIVTDFDFRPLSKNSRDIITLIRQLRFARESVHVVSIAFIVVVS